MTMNWRQYIVFDEFLLYISATGNEVQKYEITRRCKSALALK